MVVMDFATGVVNVQDRDRWSNGALRFNDRGLKERGRWRGINSCSKEFHNAHVKHRGIGNRVLLSLGISCGRKR